jgi:RNA polymerase sigma-70 factor (ECF subfamily)
MKFPGEALDPESALERWRLVEAVHRALGALDPVCRQVIVLRDLEGLDGATVARALGITEAAMKSRLHRARERVRENLVAERISRREIDDVR